MSLPENQTVFAVGPTTVSKLPNDSGALFHIGSDTGKHYMSAATVEKLMQALGEDRPPYPTSCQKLIDELAEILPVEKPDEIVLRALTVLHRLAMEAQHSNRPGYIDSGAGHFYEIVLIEQQNAAVEPIEIRIG